MGSHGMCHGNVYIGASPSGYWISMLYPAGCRGCFRREQQIITVA